MTATNTVLHRFSPGQRWYKGEYPIMEIVHEPSLEKPHQYSNGILFVRDADEASLTSLVESKERT